jgi:peptidoglycan/xylan/chitin deacetylase (PgdA/CDA1 family)
MMKKTLGGVDSIGKRSLKLAVSAVIFIADWLWRHMRQIAALRLPGTCVVLYYHAVPKEQRAKFAHQMDVLLRFSRPVRSENTEPLDSDHHVAVVFHDAFLSVCDNALPELAKRGIPSTVFVPSGFLGQRQGWIMDAAHSDYEELVVDAERLKSLDKTFVSIGSHTVTHADLSLLTEDEAREQLGRSKVELEMLVGRPVNLFAFPYGGCTKALTELAREVGYQRVFTIQPDLALLKPNEFVTGSCPASPTDWDMEFRLKLLGAYRWLPSIYALKRHLVLGAQRWFSRSERYSKPIGEVPSRGTRLAQDRASQRAQSSEPAKALKSPIFQDPRSRS